MDIKVEISQQVNARQRLSPILHVTFRLILAATFGISSIQKMVSPSQFEKVLQAYKLGLGLVHITVPLVPLIEFALMLMLLFGILIRTSSIASMALLAFYTALMGISLITGNVNHNCGCFIGVSNSQSFMSYIVGGNFITISDIIRDIVLILIALIVWFTRDPKLGLDKYWTNSPTYWRWYYGRSYLTGALIVVFVLSTTIGAITEGNLLHAANAPLSAVNKFNPKATVSIGQKAPNFSLSTVDGIKYSLDQYRGKVVLVEFFAIWCSNCHEEAPIINQLEKKFPAQKFQVLSVIASPYSKNYEISNGVDTSPYTAKDVKWYKNTYHVTNPILLDPNFSVTNEYIRQEYPNLIVINPQGRIKNQYIGPTSFNQLATTIQSLLS